MIRYLTAEERPLCRDLWEEAFPEDSHSFDDYYFTEKVKENRILAVCQEEKILTPEGIEAMIQLNPYEIQAGKKVWKTDYLVGVATRKNRRHRGYMRSLLMRMMADMYKEQMAFCFLMPASEAIYRPFGFCYIYDQPRWRLSEMGRAETERKNAADFPGEAASWMNKWLEKRYDVFAIRNEAYVEMLLKEVASEQGSLEGIYKNGKLVGFQSFWGIEKKEQRLLYGEEWLLEKAGEAKPAIMARIVNLPEFVKAIGLKADSSESLVLPIFIEDPLIPQNQGLWNWKVCKNGSCMKLQEKMDRETALSRGYRTLTITEMTEWLFGYKFPDEMDEKMEQVQPFQGVFLDEIV